MKTITVHGKSINAGQIVNTIDGRARLDYVGRQAFTNWTLIDQRAVAICLGLYYSKKKEKAKGFAIQTKNKIIVSKTIQSKTK